MSYLWKVEKVIKDNTTPAHQNTEQLLYSLHFSFVSRIKAVQLPCQFAIHEPVCIILFLSQNLFQTIRKISSIQIQQNFVNLFTEQICYLLTRAADTALKHFQHPVIGLLDFLSKPIIRPFICFQLSSNLYGREAFYFLIGASHAHIDVNTVVRSQRMHSMTQTTLAFITDKSLDCIMF